MVVGDKCIGRCTLAVPFKYSSRTVCVDIFKKRVLCDVYIIVVMQYNVVYNGVRYEAMWYVMSVDISTVSCVRFSHECLKRLDV